MRHVITARWTFHGPLHMGTGNSNAAEADRTIQWDAARNQPVLRGDAIKGAVRGAAERLVRWLVPEVAAEKEQHSLPAHPALRRLFTPLETGPRYRFHAGRCLHSGVKRRLASTAINYGTGVAKDNTLRVMETCHGHTEFQISIEASGVDWEASHARDLPDLVLLLAALAACDGAGGKKGTGSGRVNIAELSIDSIPVTPFTPQQLSALQASLRKEWEQWRSTALY